MIVRQEGDLNATMDNTRCEGGGFLYNIISLFLLNDDEARQEAICLKYCAFTSIFFSFRRSYLHQKKVFHVQTKIAR